MIHDTTPEAQRLRWQILARMSGEQRVRQALELTDFILRVRADGERARSTAGASEASAFSAATEEAP